MSGFSATFDRLLAELEKMPGIGRKTAQRLAFHLLRVSEPEVQALAVAMVDCRRNIRACSRCFSITEQDPCGICADPRRDDSLLCVVEQPSDVLAFERSGEYRGRYHVLDGVISPLEGIGPEDLRIRELLERLRDGTVREVILGTNPDLEGEATCMYLSKLIKPLGVRVTRIARGLPVGGDLEYADQVTLARALEGRRDV
ncbi:MAG: recombination mediator RecR [Candidatus Coatesbacteria bacterium]